MDCNKIGRLIYELRKEKGYTQTQLADKLNLSDRTISKWERGIGCPDISLLNSLSEIFGVNIEKILNGKMENNMTDAGNMRKLKFYVCSNCGNIITSTGDTDISCCSRKLGPLKANPANQEHRIKVEKIEEDCYITFSHDMAKSHYLSFFAYVNCDRVLLMRLYPEQGSEVRFPAMYAGELFFYCNQHGLMKHNTK